MNLVATQICKFEYHGSYQRPLDLNENFVAEHVSIIYSNYQ
jgi:hypothetical protein